ncbi:MAG TPA: hydrolase [Planctomycetaceae bacterium]|nr:hydrolase [Blastopirellula sp.]HAY82004.1 hydrolase [Planctomycetaceae bacterium]
MQAESLAFLQTLLNTPSPSGFESQIQQVVRDHVASFADEVTTDLHGNVIACKNPGRPLRIMLAGHCDQIGMLVSHIDEQGFLYAQPIGGWDPQQLVGQRMVVWTEAGPVPAVIARKPIHLLNDAERKQVVKLQELWLDIGAADKAEAREVVRIGDPVTLDLGFCALRNELANAPGMDDKTGLWVVLEALRRADLSDLDCSLYAVSTVQEEIGLRGARTSSFGIDPHVGIAVDVTHATDCPTIDQRQQGDIALGKGPVVFRGPNMNPQVVRRLIACGEQGDIPFQLAALGRAASNDSNAIQTTRAGVAAGLVAIPNRYMHSAVETISLRDIDHAADLLAAFATSVAADEDFTP